MPYELRLAVAYAKKVKDEKDLISLWESGKDFIMNTTGQYCSVRNFEDLKKEYDKITILANNLDRSGVIASTIWLHPLAGVTTYVKDYPK